MKNQNWLKLTTLNLSLMLTACATDKSDEIKEEMKISDSVILYNQLGYLPEANKQVLIQSDTRVSYRVNNSDGQSVLSGRSAEPETWPFSEQKYSLIDLTELSVNGNYQLTLPEHAQSIEIRVNNQLYRDALKQTVKSFYFNRAGAQLEPEHAGVYARKAGHPDDKVLIHSSAVSEQRPEGVVVSASKGWYDAGDYNKYAVNGSVALYTMLLAYQDFKATHTLDLNIPESNNHLPDMLDEIIWQLDWLVNMQDPNDGGVYHKLTTKNFSGKQMPVDANETRYMVEKSVSGTLDFAATMAFAAQVLSEQTPEQAKHYQQAAVSAWRWAEQNPEAVYVQPGDIKTGAYATSQQNLVDEWFWAATELALLTNNNQYWQTLADYSKAQMAVPSWSYVAPFAWLRLAEQYLNPDWQSKAKQAVLTVADKLTETQLNSAIGVPMGSYDNDFVWGSNGVAANQVLVLNKAYRLSKQPRYKQAAYAGLDYLFGKNPTGYSYVTGIGVKTPMHIHHRISEADAISEPVPGLLAGGPHSGQQDKCDGYPSDLPALSYLDHWCSYSTNEIAINWNAPLVYALASVQ